MTRFPQTLLCFNVPVSRLPRQRSSHIKTENLPMYSLLYQNSQNLYTSIYLVSSWITIILIAGTADFN